MVCLALPTFAQQSKVVTKGPIVIKEFKHDTGPRLREVAPLLPEFGTPSEHEIENNVNPNHPWSNKVQKDPVLQTAENSPSLQTPNFNVEFDGIGYGDNFFCNCMPPDNDGAPGTTQYVQYVNLTYEVFEVAFCRHLIRVYLECARTTPAIVALPILAYSEPLLRLIPGVVPAEKFSHSRCVAERFRAATVGGGECSAKVSVDQASREIRSAQKLVEEPGVEAVTCANRIDDRYRHGGGAESVPIPNSKGSTGAHFDHDGFHLLGEPGERGFHVVSPGHPHRFVLVRQQDIHVRQDLFEDAVPAVVGIVVGVERGGQAGGLNPPKNLGHMRQQSTLQEQRRHMQCLVGTIIVFNGTSQQSQSGILLPTVGQQGSKVIPRLRINFRKRGGLDLLSGFSQSWCLMGVKTGLNQITTH